jgi:hypothetical protein
MRVYSPEWLEEGVGERQRGCASGIFLSALYQSPFEFGV